MKKVAATCESSHSDSTGECLKTLEADVMITAKLESSNFGECLKTSEGHNDEEYAWDDVNNNALPLSLVKEARKEEMGHMKGKIFKVAKKGDPLLIFRIPRNWLKLVLRSCVVLAPFVRLVNRLKMCLFLVNLVFL